MSQTQLSRRKLLQTVGLSTVVGAVTATTNVPSMPGMDAHASAAPALQPALNISKDHDLHLLRRITFGATPDDLAHLQAIGRDAFIEEQLAPESLDDSAIEGMLTEFVTLNLSNAEIYANYRNGVPQRELKAATTLRAIYSKRQLYELMVDFWGNHFSMYIGDSRVKFYKTTDDREVIRANALGRFADMLLASAQSPAMLFYLDNVVNKRKNPNENYPREVMELHAVSVAANYTEEDVRNATYCLTGWSVDRAASGTHQFQFRDNWHHVGPLTVMGWSSDGTGGVNDGISLLDYLAHHESTARFIARKLCVRFVGDNPPDSVVEAATQAYLNNDTQIKPVLRAIFAHEAFWQDGHIGTKFRRPFEQLTSVMRSTNAQIVEGKLIKATNSFNNHLKKMGQPLFGWHPPNGYPDVMAAWLNTDALLARWNLLQSFVPGQWKSADRVKAGVQIDFFALLDGVTPQTAGELVDMLAQRILLQSVSDADKTTLLGYLELGAEDTVDDKTLKFKLPQLAALLLNSPYFQFR